MEIQHDCNPGPKLKDDGVECRNTLKTNRCVEASSRASQHKTKRDPKGKELCKEETCISKECISLQGYSLCGVALRDNEHCDKELQTRNIFQSEYYGPRTGIDRPKNRNKTQFASNVSKEKGRIITKNSCESQTCRRRNKAITQDGASRVGNSEEMCRKCPEKLQKKLTMEWLPVEDMVTSQYRRECVVYPVYRCLVAAYCILVVISTAVVNNDDKIYIWFTYWALYVLTLSSILRAYTAWCFNLCWKDEDGILYCECVPGILKFQWILFNISTTVTTIICIIFWVSVYDPKIGPTAVSLNTHGINLILIVLDAFISHQPVRFLHFLHSTLFCVVYAIFTLIYWAEGGTNYNNEPFIYSILDYSGNPIQAAIYASMVPLVAAPLCHSFHYFLYRLRTRLYRYCCLKSVKSRSQLDSTPDEKMLVTEVITTV